MKFSRVVFKDGISDSLERIISVLAARASNVGNIVRGKSNDIYVSKRPYTLLNEVYQKSVGLDSMISGMLLECVHESEKVVPGSGEAVIKLVLDGINQARPDHDLENEIMPLSLRSGEIRGLLSSLHFSEQVIDIVEAAGNLAGMTGKVFIDLSKTDETVIELKRGYNFSLLLPIGPFYGEKKWEKNWCKCVLIDGVIESLGEIDGILQQASQEKEPVAIFARGFSNDVINTIKVNNDRRTLDIMLISFGVDDMETINTIVDVASTVGADIITPIKGDLIVGARFSELVSVQKIVCYNGSVLLINGKTEEKVNSHVQELMFRAANEHFEIAKLLNKRIRSLSSTCVLISVSTVTMGTQNIMIEELDMALNAVGAAITWGIIRDGANDEKIIPAALKPVSKKFADLFLDSINSLSIAIVCDG